MADSSYFFVRGDDDQEYGPVGLDELREWVRENRVGLDTQVRLEPDDEPWRPWQSFPELVALFAEATSTASTSGFRRTSDGADAIVVAPMGRRMLALVLDLILSSILLTPIFFVVATLYMPDWNNEYWQFILNPQVPPTPLIYHHIMIGNMIAYSGLMLYMAGFHAAHGQTPGKAMLRLRVVDPRGEKPTIWMAVLRAIVFVISFYFFYSLPLAYAFVSPQRRALHDWVAGTAVVEAR